jgi:Ca2+-binding RTX toxin-like protein
MAYSATGTAGNDTLNQSADAGPGTIVGLAGNDLISTGTGLVTVDGGAGADTVLLQTGNTGTVTGGTENDSIWNGGNDFNSMLLMGNEGADTIDVSAAIDPLTILGGNDSNDAGDRLRGGRDADLIFGNGGADTIFATGGNDTLVGGFGNDSLWTNDSEFVFANEGNDTLRVDQGNQTIFAGQGDDSLIVPSLGRSLVFLNEGSDTFFGLNGQAVTISGGNDSADGSDSIFASMGDDIIYGNGGADTISGGSGNDVVAGGFGTDRITGAELVFANESDDTVIGGDTTFGGLGNDTIFSGRLLFGNEGNDTIRAGTDGTLSADTISGGSGADWFNYFNHNDDGNNVDEGGPIELITDVNFDEDRFIVHDPVAFAAVTSAGAATTLGAAADNALAAAFALNGNTGRVAAQFAFNGRTYLAINPSIGGQFSDVVGILIDITGAVGTIDAGDFVTG